MKPSEIYFQISWKAEMDNNCSIVSGGDVNDHVSSPEEPAGRKKFTYDNSYADDDQTSNESELNDSSKTNTEGSQTPRVSVDMEFLNNQTTVIGNIMIESSNKNDNVTDNVVDESPPGSMNSSRKDNGLVKRTRFV